MNKDMREQILKLLEDNSRLEARDIAIMLGLTEEEVKAEIKQMEKEHIICGYHTLINWDKVRDDEVTALIELRVTPQGGNGYEKLAEIIKEYPQVEMLYLLSGAYDFLVVVNGKTIKEISMFVSSKLASIPEVQSTTTHFALTKYKELGVDFEFRRTDGRMVVMP